MAEIDYGILKKGGFMRQVQKDRFSLRLRVIGGQLKAEQLAKISQIAEKFGHGYIHLTSRQGMEIPFVHIEDIDKIKLELAAAGLEPGACGPRVRTVTACQGSGICPSGLIETSRLAQEIDARYFGRELPHKFKIGITGCRNNCLKAEENDLGIKGGIFPEWQDTDCTYCGLCEAVCPAKVIKVNPSSLSFTENQCKYCGKCTKSCPTDSWKGKKGYILSFGGMFGNEIKPGLHLLPIIFNKTQVFKVIDGVIRFFETHGRPGERLGKTLARIGIETLQKELQEVMAAEEQDADAQVDITSVVCPVTFVKTKVALEELEDGQVLEVRLNDGEPIQNLPRSLKDEGHKVIKIAKSGDGTYLLRVVKGGLTLSS